MKYLKNAFELYLNSSIHVSLAIVSFCLISFLKHDVPVDQDLVFFIFFASVTGYNFVKYAGIAKLHHLSLAQNLRLIQIFSLFCFVALLFFSFRLDLKSIVIMGFMGLLTLLYAFPVLSKKRNLRSLPGIKIFIIALVWAGTTVVLPLVRVSEILLENVVVDFIQRFLFVIVLTLPFEIRDLQYDEERLGTIPQILGIRGAKILGIILLSFIAAIEIFKTGTAWIEMIPLLLSLIFTGILIWKAKINQNKFFCSFGVESIPIIYLLLNLLLIDYFPPFFD